MNLLNSKKAQGINYMAIPVVLFVFAIFSMMGFAMFLEFKTSFYATGYNYTEIQTAAESFQQGFQMYDYVTVLLLVAFLIALALTNYSIRTHPAFFIVTIIEGIFIGLFSYIFNYIFIEFVKNDIIQTVIVYFPRTMLICTNLHWVALAAIFVGSIALYGKKKSEPQTVE